MFGFSRGAFTARSFVGLIRNCGIISRRSLTHIRAAVNLYVSRDDRASPNSERAREFRVKHCPKLCLPGDLQWRREAYKDQPHNDLTELNVEYLGVWDTVGALGIPKHLKLFSFLNNKFKFHDTTLSGFVRRARHAVAADEKRRSFEPSLWTNLDDLNGASSDDPKYEQLIFPGVHGAVGGGGPVRGLSDAALEWIFQGAKAQGLEFDLDDQSPIHSMRPDPRAQLFNTNGKFGWSIGDRLMGVGLGDRRFPEMDRRNLHVSLARRYRMAADRLAERKEYRPPALRTFWEALDGMTEQHAADIESEIIEFKNMGDDRALRAPTRVRKYVVKPGDTLFEIAKREMSVGEDWEILALHNRNVGLLFEDDKLYVGSELEIPEYGGKSGGAAATPA